METSKERNKQIYEDRKKGATYSELQEKYDISVARANEIFQREDKKEENKSNEVYATLISLCEDDQLIAKTFTVLNRLGVTTAEELIKVDQKTIKKARGCGPKMQNLIMEMKETIAKKHVS